MQGWVRIADHVDDRLCKPSVIANMICSPVPFALPGTEEVGVDAVGAILALGILRLVSWRNCASPQHLLDT